MVKLKQLEEIQNIFPGFAKKFPKLLPNMSAKEQVLYEEAAAGRGRRGGIGKWMSIYDTTLLK